MIWNEFALLYMGNQSFEVISLHTFVTIFGDDSGISSILIAIF